MELELADEGATKRLGTQLGKLLAAGDRVLLEGELGAGKTFLVRAIARAAGVPPEVPVTSPTFGLVHELPGRVPILHADLYRLGDPDELVELGLLDRLEDVILLVEWGERFAYHLRPADLHVRLEIAGPHARRAHLDARSARGRVLLARLAA
ncbi:MAG: tRNA (adenosine(37)-N6)-threonylcarbamoyltransferase complex ATPase subunit type 1 TsaE [Myxococcota bacterium]